jgi:hypothetical protein
MFLLAIIIILLSLGYAMPSEEAKTALYVVTAVGAVIEIIATGVNYYGQIESIERIKECGERQDIQKKKAVILTAEFTKYLSKEYMEHEKGIFADLTPDKVSVYAAQYPEIKASETLTELVKKINSLQTAIYDEDLNVVRIQRQMRVRSRNLWILHFLMPKR